MGWLAKLLPNHSLFGRIFIWFWLVTLILIAGTNWLVRQVINDVELTPVEPEIIQQFESVALTVERTLNNAIVHSDGDTSGLSLASLLSERLTQFAREKGLPMMIIGPEPQAPVYAMPLPMRARAELFDEVINDNTPRRIQTVSANFIGPYPLFIDGQQYAFFTSNPKPFGWMFKAGASFPGYLPLVIVLLSGLFCAFLVWHLLKPIRALQQTANEMANGNLEARVPNHSLRQDEIGQLGKDFNSMAEKIARQVRAHKRLLADISHELRSPLARQQVAVDIAQRLNQRHHSSQMDSLLCRIENENQRLNSMISELLQLSRLDAKTALNMKQVDIVALLERLVKDAQFEAKSIHKRVTFAHPKEPQFIIGNDQLLSRALENILRNAIRYADNRVHIGIEKSTVGFVVAICDDGKGVEPSELKELFKPFVRLSSSRDRKTGGVGLGLSIAAKAVEAHGGSIYADNLVTGGLSVNIALKYAGH